MLQLQFSEDSKLLLSASGDYTTRIWELQSGLELRRYRERAAIVYSASFTCNPDIVTASADKKLRFYKISSGRLVERSNRIISICAVWCVIEIIRWWPVLVATA